MAEPALHPESTEAMAPVRFRAGRRPEDEGLDMTPMVDVTFLLLIFFMVTAAYSLQKSIEIPPPEREEEAAQARTIREIEQDSDYVIIKIYADNTVWVNDSMASGQEVLVKLREARDSQGASSLLVAAHPECRHETVVMALDAGNALGMENVQLATADEMDL